MGQERLSNLALLSIDKERQIDFDDIIDKFAVLKARKINLVSGINCEGSIHRGLSQSIYCEGSDPQGIDAYVFTLT